MATVSMLTMEGKDAGTVELDDAVFGIEPNEYAVQEVVKNYLANGRQGTQSAKRRGDVRGGGKKPFRQKGTGRHRQGHSTDPSQVGGGVAFAPKPRDYRYTVPKKIRRLAMLSVLSSKVSEGEMTLLESLSFEEPKTKAMIKLLENLNAPGKALILTAEKNDNAIRSAANIPGVSVSMVSQMNVYEIINHQSLILTKDAALKIQEVYR